MKWKMKLIKFIHNKIIYKIQIKVQNSKKEKNYNNKLLMMIMIKNYKK